jgi:phosphoglucosamine mutase
MSKRKLFGTDGIRGKANIYPMTCEIAMALGRAVTSYFQQSKHRTPIIIIGKDTRLSCYMLEQAFGSGVLSQGGRAIYTGPLPTPGVSFVTKSMRADAGVMISASHNSFEDNGIKIFDSNGDKLPDHIELELEKMIENPQLLEIKVNEELGRAKRLDEMIGRYIVFVKAAFNPEYDLMGLKLVLDCANGATYKVGPAIFDELGAEVYPIAISPNGTNINLDSGAMHPGNCAIKVKEQKADLGFCFDGDGDRLIVVDELGRVVDGDALIGVLAKYLQDTDQLPNTEIVGTLMSNFGLEKYIKSLGLTFFRTDVGDRYIVSRMKESGAIFGGEPSGHLIFKANAPTGDGILAALKVLEVIKYYNKPLSKLVSEVKLSSQLLINIMVKSKPDFSKNKAIQDVVASCEEQLKDSGRILLRYSGTENKARVMVEGQTDEQVKSICQKIADVVEKELA